MTGPNRLSRDGRLRSFWQVLAVYVGASWIVLQVVDVLKNNMGLPGWVFPFAVVLLLIGLPVILATALIQARPPARVPPATDSSPRETDAPVSTESSRDLSPRRLFTWRNALLGGAAAFVLLTVFTTGFMFMRDRGIGPVGSLVAKGVLDERSELVLADFESRDPDLAATATEALRIDLSQSDVVRVVESSRIRGVLDRMERTSTEALDEALAREVAIREGWPAVIVGEINEAGGRYVLSARLLAASDGAELLAVRETAAEEGEIVPAVDDLSARLRERIGESYTSLRATPPLEQVTTASLDALELYSQALAADDQGDEMRGIGLLEEAVERDSAFAMAWRKLGTMLSNLGIDRLRAVEAQKKAFEHRDRLTTRERYLTEGTYYTTAGDLDRAILAYENLLEHDPEDAWALNNVAILYSARGDDEKALEFYQRSIGSDSGNTTAYGNAASTLRDLDRPEEARDMLNEALEVAPGAPSMVQRLADLELTLGEFGKAAERYESLQDLGGGTPYWRWATESEMAGLEATRGRFEESARRRERAARISEEEGWSGTSIQRAVWSSWTLLLAKRDRAGARRVLDEALSRHPIAEVPDGEAPLLPLASIQAALGREEQAEALLERQQQATVAFATGGWEVALRILAEAHLSAARGDVDQALALLEGMERTTCKACGYVWTGLIADAAGRPQEALEAYEKYVVRPWWVRTIVDSWTLGSVLERLGQLHDEQGDPQKAAVYYAQFVDLWANADADVQPRVEAARARLQEIVRERG